MTDSKHHLFDRAPAHLRGLLQHFADLRDGTHGDGATSRSDKERFFTAAVAFLDPYARQALAELNENVLLGTGAITATGATTAPNGDSAAAWTLGWPEQVLVGINPVTLEAFYGHSSHHPHLRGGTVGDWPLNVFSDDDAAADLPTLRTIASADLHNLVFQHDYHIIPAITHPLRQTNKDVAVSFLRMVVAGEIREAFDHHVATGFTGHYPYFGASATELMAAMEENHALHPHKVLEVQRVVEEGELVVVHSRIHMQPEDRGGAAVHIFRFAGSRIMELWDVGQAAHDTSVSKAGMTRIGEAHPATAG